MSVVEMSDRKEKGKKRLTRPPIVKNIAIILKNELSAINEKSLPSKCESKKKTTVAATNVKRMIIKFLNLLFVFLLVIEVNFWIKIMVKLRGADALSIVLSA